jgi:hypothetical protein
MEQWEKSYYITAIAGSTNGSSLVVMSKGMKVTVFLFLERAGELRINILRRKGGKEPCMKVTVSCYYSCLWLEPPFSDHFSINRKYPNISLGLWLLTSIFIPVALLINHQGRLLYSFG